LDDGLLREADAQAAAYASQVLHTTRSWLDTLNCVVVFDVDEVTCVEQDFLIGLEATKSRKTPQFKGWQ
jgi:hypothetical protein